MVFGQMTVHNCSCSSGPAVLRVIIIIIMLPNQVIAVLRVRYCQQLPLVQDLQQLLRLLPLPPIAATLNFYSCTCVCVMHLATSFKARTLTCCSCCQCCF
jgi:hypothetical protein